MSISVASLPQPLGETRSASTRSRPAVLPSLTGIRFIAALVVVLFHSTNPEAELVKSSDWCPTWLAHLLGSGHSAVGFFFMLSGFILTYTYCQKNPQQIPIRKFLWARFARIYPAYLLAFLIAVPVFLAKRWRDHELFGATNLLDVTTSLLLTATLVQAWVPTYALRINGPGWSLSAEAFFYATFPWFAKLLFRVRTSFLLATIGSVWTITTLLLIAFVGPRVNWHFDLHDVNEQPELRGWIEWARFWPLWQWPSFLIGTVLGRLYLERRVGLGKGNGETFIGIGGVLIVCELFGHYAPRLLPLLDLALAPWFALLIVGLAKGGGVLGRLLSSKTMLLLGGASYSLYLLHMPILIYYKQVLARTGLATQVDGWQTLVNVLLYLAISVVASIACFLLVEEPARKTLTHKRAS